MREIKFRYYWKHDRTEEVKFYEYTLYEIKSGLVCAPDFTIRWDLIAEAQYTGLKDKNGKEIYEGDIVRYIIDLPGAEPTEYTEDVSFVDGCFAVEIVTPLYVVNDLCEVIGNIYQHQHLLKESL